MQEPLIVMQDVSHVFQADDGVGKAALSHVDLTVKRGEFVTVLGRNGSGKSTLARHCNALLLPTSGHCVVAGMDTREEKDLWKIRSHVGMVFQNPDNQLVAAVVEDDVAFGPENLGVPPQEIRSRVHESLEAVGMEHFRHCAPHLLSSGQKQRVAIAGALAMQTECLVLDEPTAMLDPQGRAEVLRTVCRLHEERGLTVVYITHFMEEATVADRIVVMDQGQICRAGTPKEIFGDVKSMDELGLSVPLAARVAFDLRRKGVKLPAGILTDTDLVQALEGYHVH